MRAFSSLFLSCLLGAVLALPAMAPEAHAVTSAEKQAEADNISAAIDRLQDKLNEATAEYERSMDAYETATAAAADASARAKAANKRIGELQGMLGDRAVSMYKGGSSTNFLEVVLGAKTFESFLTSWDAMQMIADQDAGMIEESKQVRAEAQQAEEAEALEEADWEDDEAPEEDAAPQQVQEEPAPQDDEAPSAQDGEDAAPEDDTAFS